MPTSAEIRKRQERDRQQRRSVGARTAGFALAIVLALIPNRDRWAVAIGLGVVALCLIYSLLQSEWIAEADIPIKKWTRFIVGAVTATVMTLGFGIWIWPPLHRHSLSESERQRFEKPLKEFKKPEMSVHLYCAPNDEVDCEYAAALIPLFGEGGWDVATSVDRIALGRPQSGILIGLHGTLKPEDESKLKWDQGEWAQVRPEQWAVRQAFANIGIEPDSTSGAAVPENQINIYVGHERDDETAPTLMTREYESWGRNMNKGPGGK